MRSSKHFGLFTKARDAKWSHSGPSPTYRPIEIPDDEYSPSVDIEKFTSRYRSSSDDSDRPPSSSASSRQTSDSFSPMLYKRSTKRNLPRLRAYKLPSRITRYLCWALIVTVGLFMLSLIQMSHVSTKQVEQGTIPKPPPPPPQWEEFPFMFRYYGGLRSLVSKEANEPEYPNPSMEPVLGNATDNSLFNTSSSEPEDIVPADPSTITQSFEFDPFLTNSSLEPLRNLAPIRECFLDEAETIRIPKIRAYPGVPEGFADPVIGSHSLLGIQDDLCFDRFGRLGPYGYGYSVRHGGSGLGLHGDREGSEQTWETEPEVDFNDVKWSEVQHRCIESNMFRLKKHEAPSKAHHGFQEMRSTESARKPTPAKAGVGAQEAKVSRTAVVIRTWFDYVYTTEDIIYLRSLISELVLSSGGEYTVHFLIHVKDHNAQIWTEDSIYQKVLDKALPEEFRGMGTLWSEKQMSLLYSGLAESFTRGLPVHGVYRSLYMPMQYFAARHPEYDHFWHWEMDTRYTGHFYHLFDRINNWTKAQPRKGLWERNSRFYVPSIHGSWEEFKQMTRFQTELGTDSANNMWTSLGNEQRQDQKGEKPIWGPERPIDDELDTEGDPEPPTSYERDTYQWGVGEDADFVTFNPLFDPDGTSWLLKDDVTGYNTTRSQPPRRAAIVTASRLSRKLLLKMHNETTFGRHTMFSEMWPGSVALHHGYKAVYVPHPVYIDRRWPTKYLTTVLNAGRNGATGGARTSVFGDREHNFLGTTWYYNAGFAPNLWRRWLGLKTHNDGGEQWELEGEGRMCLPPMLLHPMKGADVIAEDVMSNIEEEIGKGQEGDEEEAEV